MECRPKRRNRGEVRALAYGSSRHLPFLIYSNQNDNREIGGRAAAIDEINDFLRWNMGKEGSFPSIRGAARMLVEGCTIEVLGNPGTTMRFCSRTMDLQISRPERRICFISLTNWPCPPFFILPDLGLSVMYIT